MARVLKGASKQAPKRTIIKKTKFQADLAHTEDSLVRALKAELQLSSNTDFFSDALALFHWAVSERKRGHHIISESASGERKILVLPHLERIAPDSSLPRVDIPWTQTELESLAKLISGIPAEPTKAMIRAMKR